VSQLQKHSEILAEQHSVAQEEFQSESHLLKELQEKYNITLSN